MDIPEFKWHVAQYTHNQPTSGQSTITWSGSLSHLSHSESGQLQVEQSQPELSFPAGGHIHNIRLGYDNQGDSSSNVLGYASDGLPTAFDHGDGSSTIHHNYDDYSNTQGNIINFQLEQPTQLYDPGFQLSVAGYTSTQVSGHFESELSMHNTSANLNVHCSDYPVPLGSSQYGLHMPPPPSFPERHGTDDHHSGPNYHFTVSHGMDNPPPPSNTHHSLVSYSTSNFQPTVSNDVSHGTNDPPPHSNTYYAVPSHNSNDFQPAVSNDVSHGINDPPPHSDTYYAISSHNLNNFQPTMSNDVSHDMNNPPPPSDTYYSVPSHSLNDFQPAISDDVYYFMRSDNLNVLQAPSDPMPEVTAKLARSTPSTSCKTKRASSTQTKFLGSKYVAQESSLSMKRVSSSSLIFLTATFLHDFKEGARINMIKALFQNNLFLSVGELSTIATNTLNATVIHYTRLDAKSCLARLKGVLKEIHSDFKEVAAISWISAYELSLDISLTRVQMQAAWVTDLTALLADYLYADKIIRVTMDDGRIVLYQFPFGHTAILDLL
ncbi:hypothetical protein F4604DRAFT_1925869 [Suillus subluteus]|nr:hypothetical protein F4604DRAFT_1925869 [Suillus subluteus]